MELLIVDDEQTAIRGISMLLDWESMGIRHVWTANTIAEARDVIREENVSIVLCDIEMRNENGLYLAEWIQKNYKGVKCIIVTGHVNFDYTRKSVELNVVDYLGKPVRQKDLREAVEKAIAQLSREKKDSMSRMENERNLESHFFRSLLQEEREYDTQKIREQIERRGLSLSPDEIYYLVMMRFRIWNPEYGEKEKSWLMYNVIPEMRQRALRNIHLLGAKLGDDSALISFQEDKMEKQTLRERMKDLAEFYQTYFGCQVCIYIETGMHMEEFALGLRRLRERDGRNLIRNRGVFLAEDVSVREMPFSYPDMKIWTLLLDNDEYDKLETEVRNYIGSSYFLNGVTPERMKKLLFLYKEMWIIWLRKEQADSEAFWQAVSVRQKEEEAVGSAEQCMAWMEACVDTARTMSEGTGEKGVVRKICEYIEDHLAEDVGRKELADMVYLSPDHMARVFKKVMGLTLTDYIVEQKMKKSAELLEKTEFSVSFIASYIGYSNLSHFSGAFKNFSGFSPSKYREMHKKEENGTA